MAIIVSIGDRRCCHQLCCNCSWRTVTQPIINCRKRTSASILVAVYRSYLSSVQRIINLRYIIVSYRNLSILVFLFSSIPRVTFSTDLYLRIDSFGTVIAELKYVKEQQPKRHQICVAVKAALGSAQENKNRQGSDDLRKLI